jgi:hypothetical protein
MNDQEKEDLQRAIDEIGPEGMKRLGRRIWMAVIGFILFLYIMGVVFP